MLPKAQAIENAIRGGVRRVHVISYNSTDSLLAEVFTNEGTGTLVVADLNALSPAEQHGGFMTRLWDKGAPLDERVLAYTAGEDYLLDDRLVPYDIAASSAHADMLARQGLLSAADLGRSATHSPPSARSTRRANGASRSTRRIARRRSRAA